MVRPESSIAGHRLYNTAYSLESGLEKAAVYLLNITRQVFNIACSL